MEHNDEFTVGCYPQIHKYIGISPHSLCGYMWMFSKAVCTDMWQYLWNKATGSEAAHLYMLSGWNAFWTRRIYTFVEDAFNRPIFGAPSSWIDVMERKVDQQSSRLVPAKYIRRCLNLGSYNYLGFGGPHPTIGPQLQAVLLKCGPSMPGFALQNGISLEQRRAEQMMAEFLLKEDAIILPMGFATNSTIIPCLVGPGCLVISDSLNHASIITGVRLSGAKAAVFKHNDMDSLETLLCEAVHCEKPWKKILIIVEGIYSMEGELTNLPEVVQLKNKYGAYLYVDEAHSIGGVGPTGRGVCDHFSISMTDVDILMGTFTKSFASCGGYIASTASVISHLRTTCFASVYGASMSPVCARQIIAALQLMQSPEGLHRLTQLRDNSLVLHQGLREMGCSMLGPEGVPVVPMFLYHPNKIADFSRECFKRHLAVVTVGYPATSVLDSRVRFCVSAAHTADDIKFALASLKEVIEICGVDYAHTHATSEHQFTKASGKVDPIIASKPVTYHPQPLAPLTETPFQPRVFNPESMPIMLSSFNFLGLLQSSELKAAAAEVLAEVGCGSCGPRGFYGTTRFHLELEHQLANFHQTESAIAYSYANATMTSVVPAFAQAGDFVVWDDGAGFGIQSGLRLSRAKAIPFAHNDIQNLEEVLTLLERDPAFPNARARYLIVEGLYTNSGDIAPLPDLIRLRDAHRMKLIIDESLSIGTLGKTGHGLTEHYGLPTSAVDLIVGSLEGSMCSQGGYCVCTNAEAAYQVLNASSYCFSASAPPFSCAAACAALDVIRRDGTALIGRLQENISLLRNLLAARCPMLVAQGHEKSPVFHLRPAPGVVEASGCELDSEFLKRVSQIAWDHGVAVGVHAQSPQFVVEGLTPSLMVCASVDHTPEQLEQAVQVLAMACSKS
ncbi:serine palmitoyltransferase 1 [Pelomyxa schiedti]|nr:serine palmitoyltransferase 1 [Pelomyxa schiedti]